VRAAVTGELRLLDRAVRRSPEQVAALLHRDFVEFGASGRRWDAASVLAVMSGADADEPPIEVTELSAVVLAPGVVHVTYVSNASGRVARRSSLWRESEGEWRLWFHQGTLVPGTPDED
jgi:hypothetical protein